MCPALCTLFQGYFFKRSRIFSAISLFVGKRCVVLFEYTRSPSMCTSKIPPEPSFKLAVIPNLLLIAACKLEA